MSADKSFYVYALLDPRKQRKFSYGKYHFEFEPFYIGKGRGNRVRFSIKEVSNNNFKKSIIKKIKAEGKEIKNVLCKKNIKEHRAFKLERKLIKEIGRRDKEEGPLVNLTNGGEGSFGCIRSKAWCNKQSRRMKKTWNKRSKKEKALISAKVSKARTGRKFSKQWRLNISKALTGIKRKSFTKQHRLNISKATTGMFFTKQRKLNMSKAAKDVWKERQNGGTVK